MKSLTVCPHSQTHHQDPHYILQQDQTLLKIRRTRLQKLLSDEISQIRILALSLICSTIRHICFGSLIDPNRKYGIPDRHSEMSSAR